MRILQTALLAAIIITLGMLASRGAQAECPTGIPILGNGPIVIHDQCAKVAWDVPPTGVISHYHVRVDGIQVAFPLEPCATICLDQQNLSVTVDVEASGVEEVDDGPVSDNTQLVWQDQPSATPTPATPTPPTPTPATPTPLVCLQPTTIAVSPLPGGECPQNTP